MLLFDGVDDFLEHTAGAICTSYPYTMIALVAHTFENSGAEQVVMGQGSTTADAFHTGGFVDSSDTKYATDRSVANGSIRADKSTTPALSGTVPQWLIVHYASASDRRVAFGSSTFVTETTAMTTSISTLNRCLVGAARRSAGLLQYGKGSFGEVWWLSGSLPSTGQLDELIAGTRLPENLTGVVDGWYLHAFEAGGTYTSHSTTRTMTASGGVSASGITHPISRGTPAPVLSSPTVVSTGNAIATVRVTTDVAPSGSSTLAVRTRAAAAPAWTAAEVLASPTATLTSGASGARDFSLTGLVNGTALVADFAQTGPSNLASTASFTPSTVPGAPTIGTATAGNAQATVAGTAPASNGGATITGYRSTATPGGSTVTGASLPITHTGLTNGTGYTFTLAAQNANGYGAESAASNSVTPSAPGTAPNITVQPSNQTVTAGATATFSVTATGSGLTYQWRRNGTNISGATSSSYTTPATTVSGGSANNGDIYSVVVTGDTAPAATSSNATLTVNAATGTTLEEVMTDSTGSSIRLNQTTRVCLEPFTTIEALFTGTRTVVTGTTDPTTGRFVVPSGTVPPGKYAMFQLLPSTGAPAALQGAAFDIIDVV